MSPADETTTPGSSVDGLVSTTRNAAPTAPWRPVSLHCLAAKVLVQPLQYLWVLVEPLRHCLQFPTDVVRRESFEYTDLRRVFVAYLWLRCVVDLAGNQSLSVYGWALHRTELALSV